MLFKFWIFLCRLEQVECSGSYILFLYYLPYFIWDKLFGSILLHGFGQEDLVGSILETDIMKRSCTQYLVLLLTGCYVLHMKVGRDTSRDAEFHQLLVLALRCRDPSIWFHLSEGCSEIGWSWIIDSDSEEMRNWEKAACYSAQKAWSTCGKVAVS